MTQEEFDNEKVKAAKEKIVSRLRHHAYCTETLPIAEVNVFYNLDGRADGDSEGTIATPDEN